MKFLPFFVVSLGWSVVFAEVREVEWNVTYVSDISPDGLGIPRTVIGWVTSGNAAVSSTELTS